MVADGKEVLRDHTVSTRPLCCGADSIMFLAHWVLIHYRFIKDHISDRMMQHSIQCIVYFMPPSTHLMPIVPCEDAT